MTTRIHHRRRRPRKGVVLLICLAILVLFMLIGVTFLILSGQYLGGAKRMARHDMVGDDPQKEMERAIYQLISGPRQVSKSSIKGHELLRDMYGTDGIVGAVTGQQLDTNTNGQFVQITFSTALTLSSRPGYYNGRVFTMAGGPAAGISTRIVDYSYNNSNSGTVLVEMFESDSPNLISLINGNGGLFNYPCVINGAAFNGTGFGYVPYDSTNPSSGNLNQADPNFGMPVCLMPHFSAYLAGVPEAGGADESRDAVDNQDMALARNTPNQGVIDPSFHRRALVNFWANYIANANPPLTPVQIETMARQVVLRPLPFQTHNPNFSGSNPSLNFGGNFNGNSQAQYQANLATLFSVLSGQAGVYDVDNDGDGIPDSIWLDLDLPIKTAPDGRRYKPLVAFLVQDQDGRINLNAAGSVAHTDPSYTQQVTGPWAGLLPGSTINLPRGLGYGPADIAFGHFMASPAEFSNLITARYGADGRPGLANTNDLLSGIKTIDIPDTYGNLPITAYASPPDVWGRGAIAGDYVGQPYFPFPNPGAGYTHIIDDPYEINLSETGSQDTSGADMPYTVAELERLLRPYDSDMPTLPSRLWNLAPNTFTSPQIRRAVTTESRHVPVPNVAVPTIDRANPYLASATLPTPPYAAGTTNPLYVPYGASASFSDLFAAKLAPGVTQILMAQNMNNPPTPAALSAEINKQLSIMTGAELYRGQLFNINRWISNGVDDDGDFIADDAWERQAGEWIWGGSVPFSYGNGGEPFITNARYAPQVYARHLYCMMMLLADMGYIHPVTSAEIANSAPTAGMLQELTARRIAQWAINVVDFRDSDSIMTPFEYDVNPFNGWGGTPGTPQIDGDPNTDEYALAPPGSFPPMSSANLERRIVWGCEFPDLLITETKSFHDRRVKDTNLDTPSQFVAMNKDDDLDQFRIPSGSLFVELYCPKTSNNGLLPRELYNGVNRLNLAARTPASAWDNVQHPVWQLAITVNHQDGDVDYPYRRALSKPDSTSFQPENMNIYLPTDPNGIPIGAAGTPAPLKIERWVWFSPPITGGPAPDSNLGAQADQIFYNSSGNLAAILPGQYAVVGPRKVTTFGSKVTADPTVKFFDGPAKQTITLNPGNVVYTDVNGVTPVVQVQAAVGIVCDANTPLNTPVPWNTDPMKYTPRRVGLNVTEPLPQSPNYYKEPDWTILPDGVSEGFYDDPDPVANMNKAFPDEPFDSQVGRLLRDKNMTASQTYLNRNSIFLQRLANPREAWHPLGNPYITIDWAAVDTSVYTGEDDTTAKPIDPIYDPPEMGGGKRPNYRIQTRERGELIGGVANGNIWYPLTNAPPVTMNPGPGDGTYYFPYTLTNTFSYLNRNVSGGSMLTSPPYPIGYAGCPASPFPTLCWLNRPFASPLELMQVPFSSQGRLLSEFTIDKGFWNPYDSAPVPPLPDNYAAAFHGPYWHTLNFLSSSRLPTIPIAMPNDANNPPVASGNFHRLFDLIETPSPFVGTERWYNPQVFNGAVAVSSANGFRPPYNRLSRFRDPGRINLNTIYDPLVFSGLMKGYFPQDPSFDGGTFFQNFLQNRQGYNGVNSMNANYPTEVAGFYGSSASADLAPAVPGVSLRRDGTEATLLRSDPNVNSQPMFSYKPNPFGNEVAYNNSRYNSQARYHPIQRLANLTTTHSNVYAIWITVGYFECEPTTNLTVHPDGYQLGQEIGIDSGEVKRHRAFYVFDRSIPVAYQPGENHNVDRAVLLKRFIE